MFVRLLRNSICVSFLVTIFTWRYGNASVVRLLGNDSLVVEITTAAPSTSITTPTSTGLTTPLITTTTIDQTYSEEADMMKYPNINFSLPKIDIFSIPILSKTTVDSKGLQYPKLLNIKYAFEDPDLSIPLAEGEDIYKRFFDYQNDFSGKAPTVIGKCGGKYTGLNGEIASPRYPHSYPKDSDCEYTIEVPSDYKAYLTCPYVSIQGGHDQCDKDYFQVFTGVEGSVPKRYCGEMGMEATSASNTMTLLFKSDSSSSYNYRGFICSFHSLDDNGDKVILDSPESEKPLVDNCNPKPENGWSGKCGVDQNDVVRRVAGGDPAEEHEFPWMAAVLKACGKGNTHYCHICGGTVILTEWILTAAHCVAGKQINDLALLLGDHNLYTLTPSQKFFRVKHVHIHPRFGDPTFLSYNVALLQTPQKMEFSRSIGPICMPLLNKEAFLDTLTDDVVENGAEIFVRNSDYDNPDIMDAVIHDNLIFRIATIPGWGAVNFENDIGRELSDAKIEILPNGVCDHYYGVMNPTLMCHSGKDGKGPCYGDSGSPIQIPMKDGRWVQLGIQTFGAALGCGSDYPSVSGLVSEFVDWVQFKTQVDFSKYY